MSSLCGFTEIVLEGEAANDVYALLSRAKEVTHELMGIVWFLMLYAYLFRTIPVQHSGDTRSLFCE